mgnify:CR=1 FL=1
MSLIDPLSLLERGLFISKVCSELRLIISRNNYGLLTELF